MTRVETLIAPLIPPLMDELLVPGVVVAIKTPDETWQQGFGSRTLDRNGPQVEPDDHFRVGSNTKTMTGTAILQLVDEGLVELDDAVSPHVPSVHDARLDHVTVRELLEMRSGLPSYSELQSFNELLDEQPERAWQPVELVQYALAECPHSPPGKEFHYSNTNTVLAGLMVEHHDQAPLEEALKRRIFDRLALLDTFLPPVTSAIIPEPFPHGYMYGTNASTVITSELSAEDQRAARAGTLLPWDYTTANPSWGWAAGAAISTAAELVTYVEALVGGGLVSAGLQEQRLASVASGAPSDPASAAYGLALAKFGPMIGHDGSLPGYTSFMGHDPTTGTSLIVLTNLQSSPDGRMVANEFAKPIIGALAAR